VVARSQFRGTLKRRTYLAHAASGFAVGCEVFAANDPEQPCGTVVQVAPSPEGDGGVDALVSLQIAATEHPLRVMPAAPAGAADGIALQLLPLPYPLLDDI
jgi:folate-binding Fe-S cluster repair protein YgfZ